MEIFLKKNKKIEKSKLLQRRDELRIFDNMVIGKNEETNIKSFLFDLMSGNINSDKVIFVVRDDMKNNIIDVFNNFAEQISTTSVDYVSKKVILNDFNFEMQVMGYSNCINRLAGYDGLVFYFQ